MAKDDAAAQKPEEKKDSKTEELKKKIEDLEFQVKRTLADYQNLEKRARDERSNWIQTANKDLLKRFLPVLDTLSLAAVHSKDQSIQISLNQFLDILKNEGATKIKTENCDFDPSLMECIETVKVTENSKKGKVIEETRAGYVLNDTILLRPAQVKVGE